MRLVTLQRTRRGAVVIIIAILMIPFMAMVSFAVDMGYLTTIHTLWQRSANPGALAAAEPILLHAYRLVKALEIHDPRLHGDANRRHPFESQLPSQAEKEDGVGQADGCQGKADLSVRAFIE